MKKGENMKRPRNVYHVILASLMGLTVTVQATLWVQEGFDYATGALDGSQSNGVGFAASSSWGSAASGTIASGLGYAGFVTAGAGAIKSAFSGSHERELSTARGGSTFYMSMLVNASGSESQRTGFELRVGGGDGPLFGRVTGGWGMFSGPNGCMGISNSGGDFKIWTGVSNAVDSATHLIVVKFDYAASAIKLFVDPVPDGAEPAPSATLTNSGPWTVNLNSATWTKVRNFHDGVNKVADELRIGTAWADVVPTSPVIAAWVQEGFDYATGALDGSQSNGAGFATSSWGTGSGSIVTGLTYSNLVTYGAGACQSSGYAGHERATAATYGGSTFYMSMLVNANGHETERCGFELRNGDGPLFGRVGYNGWGMFGGPNGQMGIVNSDGSYQTWTGVTNAADSVTHLIVAKLDYANNAIQLFVDPAVSGVEPAPSASLVTGGKWTVNLNSQLWTGVRFFHQANGMTVDELRIGRTWGSVVPALVLVWVQTAGGAYAWVTHDSWAGGSVPNPSVGCTLDLSAVDLAGDMTLSLDAPRIATLWKFGDTAGAQNWTINTGLAGGKLILAGTAPGLHVNTNTTTINAVIDGTAGLTKSGAGTLILTAANNYSGATTISAGTLTLGGNGVLPVGTGVVLSGGTLELANATNSVVSLNVKANSTFALGSGTGRLTFTGDSSSCAWTGNLTLTGTLVFPVQGESCLRFAPYGLTALQLRRISLDGLPVHLNASGYLMPGAQGTVIMVF